MIRTIYLKNGESAVENDISKIPQVMEQNPRVVWLDLIIDDHELSNEEISILYDVFKFHELSIEDALIPQYHPKVEEFENYVFVAVHGLKGKVKDFSRFDDMIYELDIFLGKNFVVTIHSADTDAIDVLFEKTKLKPQIELRSVEYLLYSIFQKVVSSYDINIDSISETFDHIESDLLKGPSKEIITEIISLNKFLLETRKLTDLQKNVYQYFTRETTGFIAKKATAYFRDIFFQMDRLNQSIISYNQLIGSILEVYVSTVTLKLNEVIKFLTVIATIFLPALLITSYYGMNVLPFMEHRILGADNVWYFAFSLIVISTLVTYIYIRRKKWF